MSSVENISSEQAANLLKQTEGRIFSVRFTKRTTGEVRDMVCRTGVKAHLKGGEAAYSFSEKMLLSVFDMEKGGYRAIPLDAIISLKEGGKEYVVIR